MENATRAPLFLEYLRFEAPPHLSAEQLPREQPGSQDPGQPLSALERYVDALKVGGRGQGLRIKVVGSAASSVGLGGLPLFCQCVPCCPAAARDAAAGQQACRLLSWDQPQLVSSVSDGAGPGDTMHSSDQALPVVKTW